MVTAARGNGFTSDGTLVGIDHLTLNSAAGRGPSQVDNTLATPVAVLYQNRST